MYPWKLFLGDIPLPVLEQVSCLCSLLGPSWCTNGSWGGEAALTPIPLQKPLPCYCCSHVCYPRQWENPLSNKGCLEACPAVGCSGLAGDKVMFVLEKAPGFQHGEDGLGCRVVSPLCYLAGVGKSVTKPWGLSKWKMRGTGAVFCFDMPDRKQRVCRILGAFTPKNMHKSVGWRIRSKNSVQLLCAVGVELQSWEKGKLPTQDDTLL